MRRVFAVMVTTAAAAWMALALAACSQPGSPASPSAAPAPSATDGVTHTLAEEVDAELRAELLAMLERDQAERLGGEVTEGDQARTDRLSEIITDFGWPGVSLVGDEGEDAAWAIAQHSDLDPEFQRDALGHLRAAVEADDASPGNLAYLEDRVAAGAGEPQLYGTQVRCGEDGPEPATPIEDEESVDERREAAGLAPLAEYLAEMAGICAEVP